MGVWLTDATTPREGNVMVVRRKPSKQHASHQRVVHASSGFVPPVQGTKTYAFTFSKQMGHSGIVVQESNAQNTKLRAPTCV